MVIQHPFPLFLNSSPDSHLILEIAHYLSLVLPRARWISHASVILRLIVAVPLDAIHDAQYERIPVSKGDWAIVLVGYLYVQQKNQMRVDGDLLSRRRVDLLLGENDLAGRIKDGDVEMIINRLSLRIESFLVLSDQQRDQISRSEWVERPITRSRPTGDFGTSRHAGEVGVPGVFNPAVTVASDCA